MYKNKNLVSYGFLSEFNEPKQMRPFRKYFSINYDTTKKIFMGDTGSLLIGFCIGFLSLKFLAIDISLYNIFAFKPENELFVLTAILCIPLFDMFRVIGVRMLKGKSPFYPDRNHIHHVLVDTGLPHYKVALILGGSNYAITVLFIYLSTHYNYIQMLGISIVLFVTLLGVFYKLKLNNELKKKVVLMKYLDENAVYSDLG